MSALERVKDDLTEAQKDGWEAATDPEGRIFLLSDLREVVALAERTKTVNAQAEKYVEKAGHAFKTALDCVAKERDDAQAKLADLEARQREALEYIRYAVNAPLAPAWAKSNENLAAAMRLLGASAAPDAPDEEPLSAISTVLLGKTE